MLASFLRPQLRVKYRAAYLSGLITYDQQTAKSCYLTYVPLRYLRVVNDHRSRQLGNRICRRTARPAPECPIELDPSSYSSGFRQGRASRAGMRANAPRLRYPLLSIEVRVPREG